MQNLTKLYGMNPFKTLPSLAFSGDELIKNKKLIKEGILFSGKIKEEDIDNYIFSLHSYFSSEERSDYLNILKSQLKLIDEEIKDAERLPQASSRHIPFNQIQSWLDNTKSNFQINAIPFVYNELTFKSFPYLLSFSNKALEGFKRVARTIILNQNDWAEEKIYLRAWEYLCQLLYCFENTSIPEQKKIEASKEFEHIIIACAAGTVERLHYILLKITRSPDPLIDIRDNLLEEFCVFYFNQRSKNKYGFRIDGVEIHLRPFLARELSSVFPTNFVTDDPYANWDTFYNLNASNIQNEFHNFIDEIKKHIDIILNEDDLTYPKHLETQRKRAAISCKKEDYLAYLNHYCHYLLKQNLTEKFTTPSGEKRVGHEILYDILTELDVDMNKENYMTEKLSLDPQIFFDLPMLVVRKFVRLSYSEIKNYSEYYHGLLNKDHFPFPQSPSETKDFLDKIVEAQDWDMLPLFLNEIKVNANLFFSELRESGMSVISYLISHHQIHFCERLVEQYPDLIYKKDGNNYTMLHGAVIHGNLNFVKHLLKLFESNELNRGENDNIEFEQKIFEWNIERAISIAQFLKGALHKNILLTLKRSFLQTKFLSYLHQRQSSKYDRHPAEILELKHYIVMQALKCFHFETSEEIVAALSCVKEEHIIAIYEYNINKDLFCRISSGNLGDILQISIEFMKEKNGVI